jgi:MerR family transcriptional regulator/heat shock protein HspR
MPSPIEDPVISIGVLAERVGLSVSAVRKYENEGLVLAHRGEGGRRLFCHHDIDRIRHIQHLIQDLGLNIEGIRRLQALLPCWELLPCDTSTRDRCPAYRERTRPCWAMKGLECAQQGNACRQCAVYRLGSLRTDAIKSLVHDQRDDDADPVMTELFDRRRHTSAMER